METPIFVKIDQYKELSAALDSVDKKLRECSAMLEHLEKLTEEENQQLRAWKESLTSVQAKSEGLHKMLMTPKAP